MTYNFPSRNEMEYIPIPRKSVRQEMFWDRVLFYGSFFMVAGVLGAVILGAKQMGL